MNLIRLTLLASLLFLSSIVGGQAAFAQSASPTTLANHVLATPDLINQAHERGEISEEERLRFLSYALYSPDQLPDRFRSPVPWSGTQYALEIARAPQVQSAALNAGFCDQPGNFASMAETAHFAVEYTLVQGGLSGQDYADALEAAYAKFVTDYQWQAPVLEQGQTKYRVQIAPLGSGLYGYTLAIQTEIRANKVQVKTNCMVLNQDFSQFASVINGRQTTASQVLAATATHEFHHMLQNGYGARPGNNKMWTESTATWSEDEVAPDVHDNYGFLWPDFRSCLREYKNARRNKSGPYTNWLFFRYLTEHQGGPGVSGGGEELMQIYYEGMAGGKEPLEALDFALNAQGMDLDQAYHDYAITTQFMRSCPEDAPYCFEQALDYVGAAGTIGFHDAIFQVGDTTIINIEEGYALAWISLPVDDDPYNITVESLSTGADLQITVVALTNDGLDATPLPDTITGRQSETLRDYTPPPGTSRVIAVITNHAVTNDPVCSVAQIEITTDRPTPPPPPPPPVCADAGLNAASLSATSPLAGLPTYALTVITGTEAIGVTTIDPYVSINGEGTVAFIAQQDRDANFIFAAKENETAQLIAEQAIAQRRFSPGLQINDANQVVAHDQQPAVPTNLTKVRLWDANGYEDFTNVATAQFQIFPDDFDAVFSYPSLNNTGEVAFSGIGRHRGNGYEEACEDTCLARTIEGDDKFALQEVQTPIRPMLADNGKMVVKFGPTPNDPIRVYDSTLTNFTEVANAEMGFSDIGRSPAISDDGRVVAFYAELNASGAQQLSTTEGIGIFAAIEVDRTWHLQRVAGVAGNGQLDPGETWNDSNGDGVLNAGEDRGSFTRFFMDERLGVASDLSRPLCGAVLVTFMAEDPSAAKVGVYATKVHVDSEVSRFSIRGISTAAESGQRLSQQLGNIQQVGVGDPINDKGQIAFWTETDQGKQVVVRANPAKRPVLVVPGIMGSFGQDMEPWLATRETTPVDIRPDPILRAYDDIVQTLINAGYCDSPACGSQNLFVATYDWRLPAAPIDGSFDGQINGLSAATIADGEFDYGVDFLGYWLRRAAEEWDEAYPGTPLDGVDIIAHSNGGILTRSYIQSDAYGGTFTSSIGRTLQLPEIDHFIMIGTPNRGASKSWNTLHDNWIVDMSSALVLAKMMKIPYKWVTQDGRSIRGPEGEITLATITDDQGEPDPLKFIRQYVPTIRYLGPTYDFLRDGSNTLTDVNDRADLRNDLLLDLNAGYDTAQPAGDPNVFATLVNDEVVVIYGDGEDTPITVNRQTGINIRNPLSLLSLEENLPHVPDLSETWYKDVFAAKGDGTVPTISAIGQFDGAENVSVHGFTNGSGGNTVDSVEHVPLMANRDVQKLVLETLGLDPDRVELSTDLINDGTWGQLAGAWNSRAAIAGGLIRLDPVEAFLVDGEGRRLGYTEATGPVTEIPNSHWFGETNGIGWFFSALTPPYTLELSGLGESYDVLVSLEQQGGDMSKVHGGTAQQGFLAAGETKTFTVPTTIQLQNDLLEAEPDRATPSPTVSVTPTATATSIPSVMPSVTSPATPQVTPPATPTKAAEGNNQKGDDIFLPIVADGSNGNKSSTPAPTPPQSNSGSGSNSSIVHLPIIHSKGQGSGQGNQPGGTPTATTVLMPTATPPATSVASVTPTPSATASPSTAVMPPTATPSRDPSDVPPPVGSGYSRSSISGGGVGRITDMDLSPDGTRYILGGENGNAVIADAATGKVIMEIGGHTNAVDAVALSPDGAYALTGGREGQTRLWEVATGTLRHTFVRHGYWDSVKDLTFSPDGTQILVGMQPRINRGEARNAAVLWDVATGEIAHSFNDHAQAVTSVAMSPDGSRVAAGGFDKSIIVWEVATGEIVRKLTGHTWLVSAVDFSPDGERLLSADESSGGARIWTLRTGAFQPLEPANQITAAAFAHDGSRVAALGGDGVAHIWDAATGDRLSTLNGHSAAGRALHFSRDDSTLYTAAVDGNILQWSTAPQQWERQELALGYRTAMALSPDGTQMLLGSNERTITLHNSATGELVRTFSGHITQVNAVAFSPDGTRAISGDQQGILRLWTVADASEVINWQAHTGQITTVAFSGDGTTVMTAGHDQTAKLWDAATGTLLLTFDHVNSVYAAAYSNDGNYLATVTARDFTLHVWDAKTGESIRTETTADSFYSSVAFSGDGTRLAFIGRNSQVLVQETLTGATHILPHDSPPQRLAFSADGTVVLTADRGGVVWLWDALTGIRMERFYEADRVNAYTLTTLAMNADKQWGLGTTSSGDLIRWQLSNPQLLARQNSGGHSDAVEAIAIAPDEETMLTGSWDNRVIEWDIVTRKPLRVLHGHKNRISAVAYAPNDRTVAVSGDGFGQVFVWDLTTAEIVRIIRLPSTNDKALGLAISPDGTQLAVASSALTAYLIALSDGSVIHTLADHNGAVNAVRFSPDGTQLVTAGSDDQAILWDVATGTIAGTFGGHGDDVLDVDFSRDGNRVLTVGKDGLAQVWDVNAFQIVQSFERTMPVVGGTRHVPFRSGAFSADGSRVLLGDYEFDAHLWDMASGSLLRSYEGHNGTVSDVALIRDGTLAITAGGYPDESVRFWDTQSTSLARTITVHMSEVPGVALSDDGTQGLSAGCDLRAALWSTADGNERQSFTGHNHGDTPCLNYVAFSPDGNYAFTGNTGGGRLWDLQTNEFLQAIFGHRYAQYHAVFSADSTQLLTAGGDRAPISCLADCGSAKLWDVATGELVQTFTTLNIVYRAAISPDGLRVVTGSADGEVVLWDAQSGERLRQFNAHSDAVYGLDISPDGSQIVTAAGQDLFLWDLATGTVRHAYGHPTNIRNAAFGPNGKTIVTAAGSNGYLWDARNGSLKFAMGHHQSLYDVAISGNGQYVATASQDFTVRLWNVDEGMEAEKTQ